MLFACVYDTYESLVKSANNNTGAYGNSIDCIRSIHGLAEEIQLTCKNVKWKSRDYRGDAVSVTVCLTGEFLATTRYAELDF